MDNFHPATVVTTKLSVPNRSAPTLHISTGDNAQPTTSGEPTTAICIWAYSDIFKWGKSKHNVLRHMQPLTGVGSLLELGSYLNCLLCSDLFWEAIELHLIKYRPLYLHFVKLEKLRWPYERLNTSFEKLLRVRPAKQMIPWTLSGGHCRNEFVIREERSRRTWGNMMRLFFKIP